MKAAASLMHMVFFACKHARSQAHRDRATPYDIALTHSFVASQLSLCVRAIS